MKKSLKKPLGSVVINNVINYIQSLPDALRGEFMVRKEIIHTIIKPLVTIIIPLMIYWEDFIIIKNEAFNSELSSHIIALPFMVGYFIYQSRDVFIVNSKKKSDLKPLFGIIQINTLMGMLLMTLSYLIRWYGAYTFTPLEYHIFSLPIFISGVVLILYNFQTLKVLFPPILFLLYLTPPPIDYAQRIGAYLSLYGAQTSYRILKILGFTVSFMDQYASPIITLTRPNGEVINFAIDLACSGLYSLIGLLLFTSFIAYVSKGTVFRKIIVFFIGFPIIYCLNLLRILLLILTGYYSGLNIALNVFHLFGGWVFLFFGSLLLIMIANRFLQVYFIVPEQETCLHLIKDAHENYCLQCGRILKQNPMEFSLPDATKIFGLIIITLFLLTLQVPVFSLTSGKADVFVKNPSGEENVANVLPTIDGYDLNFVYRDVEFEEISGQNASLMYRYMSDNEIVWVALEISPSKYNMHHWEACLITVPEMQGWEVTNTKLDLRDIHLLENPPLSARYFAYFDQLRNHTQVILYWYTQSEFLTDNGYESMWSRISVIKYAESPSSFQEVEEDILPFAEAIVDYWTPISTWSRLGIVIAENGLFSITFITLIMQSLIIYAIYLMYKQSNEAKKIYKKIDKEDKLIIDIIINNKPMKENDILLEYQKETGKDMDLKQLDIKLSAAEKVGLLDRIIVALENKPCVFWKSKFKI